MIGVHQWPNIGAVVARVTKHKRIDMSVKLGQELLAD